MNDDRQAMADRRAGRFLARDTGADIAFAGVDRHARAASQGGDRARVCRHRYDCSATCSCGDRFNAQSLAGLRDQLALHMLDCPGAD